MQNSESFFSDSDLIFSYTKEDAVNDGLLVDLSKKFPQEVKEAGIKIPVYCTQLVFCKYVELSLAAERACNDVIGRVWDLIWMSRNAMKKAFSTRQEVLFIFYCVTNRIKPSKCICKVSFDGEAFIILEPQED